MSVGHLYPLKAKSPNGEKERFLHLFYRSSTPNGVKEALPYPEHRQLTFCNRLRGFLCYCKRLQCNFCSLHFRLITITVYICIVMGAHRKSRLTDYEV